MKKIFFVMTVLCLATLAEASTTLEGYLARLPAAPRKCCGVSGEEKSTYRAAISDVGRAMEEELRLSKKETKAAVAASRDKIEDSLTPQTIKPRKSGKLTKEEKKARAEEMMRQYGVSPEDRKKLKTMSKEEKTAWALSTSANASGKMQADPKYASMNNEVKSLADQQDRQRAALARIEAGKNVTDAITGKIKALDQKAAAAQAKDIAPIERELASIPDIITTKKQKERVDELVSRIKKARMRYCETFSPQYLALVNEYQAALQAQLPDYQKLADVSQTQFSGVDKSIDTNEGAAQGIKAIRAYGDLLQDAFKYDLAK